MDKYKFLESGNFPILQIENEGKETFNSEVLILQNLLNEYFDIPIENKDGYFGIITHELVVAFQIKEKIQPVNGIVSIKTWKKIREIFFEKRRKNIYLPTTALFSTGLNDEKKSIAKSIIKDKAVPFDILIKNTDSDNILDKITRYVHKDCVSAYLLLHTIFLIVSKQDSILFYVFYIAFMVTIPIRAKKIFKFEFFDYAIPLISFFSWTLLIGTPFDGYIPNPKFLGLIMTIFLIYLIPLLLKKSKSF